MRRNQCVLIWLTLATTCLLYASAVALEENLLRKLNFIPETKSVPAPEFTTVDVEGRVVGLESYEGKVVILNFWATWCPPCRLEMPSMEKLYRQFKDQGLEVVAVNFMESLEPVRAFATEQGLTYPILMDTGARISEAYGVRRLPETVLIGRSGNLLGRSAGYKDWYKQDVRELVALLLEDEASVLQGARESSAAADSRSTARDPYLLLAFGLAVVMLLAYYVKRARARKTEPVVRDV